MRFQAAHRFHGSPTAVASILANPRFYVGLRLPDLSQPEVVEQRADGPHSVLRLRYIFVGSLDTVARRLLGQRQLTWIQEIDINRRAASGGLTFHAEAAPGRLHGSAQFTVQTDGKGSVRRLTGEVVVAVPIIQGRAERQIVAGLLRRLDIEAECLDHVLPG